MSNGAELEYKFGNKNNWRRWKWNRIVERLHVNPRDAVVIYLAGPEDLDRPIAESHGIRSANMIAVEREKLAIETLRQTGALAVHADVLDVLGSWNRDEVHVVDLDYCCGFGVPQCGALQVLAARAVFGRAVISVNLLHGRDAAGNDLRQQFRNCLQTDEDSKHRGKQFFVHQLVRRFAIINQSLERDGHEPVKPTERDFGVCFRYASPAFNSYWSPEGHSYMDSAVFRNMSVSMRYSGGVAVDNYGRLPSKADGSIRAICAHRTRRLAA